MDIRNIQIFSDFDGTITKKDTLNEFLRINADPKWLEIEQRWIDGEIGSKECLKEQMQLFKNFSKTEIDKFIKNIEIDDTFIEFYKAVKKQNIDFFILSDGLDYFIRKVLANNGITDAKIYANRLLWKETSLDVDFPNCNDKCDVKAGMCKCLIVEKCKNNVEGDIVYIGDGVSDFCVSKKADFLFAKGKLLNYYSTDKEKKILSFFNFSQIAEYIGI